MARARTPLAKAKATGRSARDPKRFKARSEPAVHDGLGEPPVWLTDKEDCKQIQAWKVIRAEIPWLNSSHRLHVAGTCQILGRLIAGQEVGVQALNLLRMQLGQMGATPSDASKVGAMPDDEEDPDEDIFERPE